MAYFPPIPTRFSVSGDISAGKTLMGFARKQVGMLRLSMNFQKLPTGERNFSFADGTHIRATIIHGLSYVDIHVPSADRGKKRPCLCDQCFANVNFAVCRIVAQQDYSQGTEEGCEGDNVRYNLEVCNRSGVPCVGYKYISYENCMITDFTHIIPDEEGQENIPGYIHCALVVLHGFEPEQMGTAPLAAPDSAQRPKQDRNSVAPTIPPIYKVLPLYAEIPEWEFENRDCS